MTVSRLQHSSLKKPVDAGGKSRDSVRTRQRILTAAQDCFAGQAYSHVGLRDIATLAGIDVAMVARYYGTKENLFRAAFSALTFREDLPQRPKAGFGRAIVEAYLASDELAIKPLQMLVRSAGDPAVGAVVRELVDTQIMAPLASWLGGPDAQARVAKILALIAGFFTYRVMVPLAPFSGPLSPEIRNWLERSIQDIVDGETAPACSRSTRKSSTRTSSTRKSSTRKSSTRK